MKGLKHLVPNRCLNLGAGGRRVEVEPLRESPGDPEEDAICATVEVAGPFGMLNGRAPGLTPPVLEELAGGQYGHP